MRKRYVIILVLFSILVLQLILRVPFLSEPLESDEGVYAFMGQRVLAGEVPYRDYFDHKPPVVYYIYALIFKIFGQTIFSIRFATALLSLLTAIFIFLAGRRLFSEAFGLVSAFLYALFSGGPMIEGAGSNTEVFMVLFLMAAFYFFTGKRTTRDLFFCGLFSGLAFMTKQVAALNFLVLLMFVFWEPEAKRLGSLLILGFLIFPLGFTLYFWLNRGLAEFIDYAFLFNLGYTQPSLNLFSLYRTLYIALVENSVLWLLALGGMLYIIIRERERKAWLITLYFLASLVGVYLGGFFFGHYYIQVIPAMCLLSALFVIRGVEFKPYRWLKIAGALMIIILFTPILLHQWPFYFKYSAEEISFHKFNHANNVLAYKVAQKIGDLKGQYISAGYFPQIYFYTKSRYSGKYFYGLATEGIRIKLFLLKRQVYSKNFEPKIGKNYIYSSRLDFHKSLENKRTRYAVFTASGTDLAEARKEMGKIGYIYRPDVSEADCRVFKRI